MKRKIWLRIAAALMMLHTAGHTMGALTWKTPPNASVGKVINGMESNPFMFMGRSVTIASFYDGYGFIMIGMLLLISVLLFLLSFEAATQLSYRVTAALSIFLLLMAIIELIYFFPFAAGISFLAALASGIALFKKDPLPTLN